MAIMNESKTNGLRIALPETREAEQLTLMVREQGAETVSCPLVSIVDVTDPTPLQAWLCRLVDTPFDDLEGCATFTEQRIAPGSSRFSSALLPSRERSRVAQSRHGRCANSVWYPTCGPRSRRPRVSSSCWRRMTSTIEGLACSSTRALQPGLSTFCRVPVRCLIR